jgi:hypothetical protein
LNQLFINYIISVNINLITYIMYIVKTSKKESYSRIKKKILTCKNKTIKWRVHKKIIEEIKICKDFIFQVWVLSNNIKKNFSSQNFKILKERKKKLS